MDISYFRFACVFFICFLFDRLENPVEDNLWVSMANEVNMASVMSSEKFHFLFDRLVQDMEDDCRD